ncbi:MAG: hypothetical protein AAFQ43_01510 [Bacteroidota bacterium]
MRDTAPLAEGGGWPLAPEAGWRVWAVSAGAFAAAALCSVGTYYLMEGEGVPQLSTGILASLAVLVLTSGLVGAATGSRLATSANALGPCVLGAAIAASGGLAYVLTAPSVLSLWDGRSGIEWGALLPLRELAEIVWWVVPFGTLAGWLVWRWHRRQRPLASSGADE